MNESENLKAWLAQPTGATRTNGEPQTNRDLFNLVELEVRAGVPKRGLHKWLSGNQSLAPVHLHNLLDVLSVHGYTPLTNEHNFL